MHPQKHPRPGTPFLITEHNTNFLAYEPSKLVVATNGTLVVNLVDDDSVDVTLPDMGGPWTWEISGVVRVKTASTCSNIVGIG
jgi:predicted secreted protein